MSDMASALETTFGPPLIPPIPPDIAESVSRLCEILDVPGLSPETKRAINTVRLLVDDQQGNVGIEVLDLTVRAYNVLKRCGVHTVRDLAGCTSWTLLDMRNFGSKAYDTTEHRLTVWVQEHGPLEHTEAEYIPAGDHCFGCHVNRKVAAG